MEQTCLEKNQIEFIEMNPLKHTVNATRGFKQKLENQLLEMLLKGFLLKDILLRSSFNVTEEYPIDRFCLFFSTF